MKKLKVVVLGEKPQGESWLKMLIASEAFDIIAGVPRGKFDNAWWGSDEFDLILRRHDIPVVKREDLKKFEYDIIWSTMYGFIIETDLIKKARYCGLNLHETPLPRYRGCNGYSFAILENAATYGTTFQFLGAELDSGEIIDQEIFPIQPDMTVKELYVHTKVVSDQLFRRNIPKVAQQQLVGRATDLSQEPIRNRASLLDLKPICLSQEDSVSLRRKARAFDFIPFEPTWAEHQGERYYFFINNAFGRLNHQGRTVAASQTPEELVVTAARNKGLVLAGNGPRNLVVMSKTVYAQHYPLFFPKYSGAIAHAH